jgi:hypothetical protein
MLTPLEYSSGSRDLEHRETVSRIETVVVKMQCEDQQPDDDCYPLDAVEPVLLLLR